eukprot:856149-Pelagomonas_calceolata.AAC.1
MHAFSWSPARPHNQQCNLSNNFKATIKTILEPRGGSENKPHLSEGRGHIHSKSQEFPSTEDEKDNLRGSGGKRKEKSTQATGRVH